MGKRVGLGRVGLGEGLMTTKFYYFSVPQIQLTMIKGPSDKQIFGWGVDDHKILLF